VAHCGAAPAPELGAGVPAVLVVGGVLLATALLARWRRSQVRGTCKTAWAAGIFEFFL
jgi:hypothetical protein